MASSSSLNNSSSEGGAAAPLKTCDQDVLVAQEEATTTPAAGKPLHPLQTRWTFWCDRKVRLPNRKESDGLMSSEHYARNLKKIHTFGTVEEFYRAFTFIKRASELPTDYNISLFREGHLPMWEEFPSGGMWIVRVKRGQTVEAAPKRKGKGAKSVSTTPPQQVPLIDVMWECLVLACVGEVFAIPHIVGCVLSIRNKENVLSLWNVDNENPEVRLRIGQKFRELCALPSNSLMRYKDFQQAMKDCSSYRNAQRYLFTTKDRASTDVLARRRRTASTAATTAAASRRRSSLKPDETTTAPVAVTS